MTTQPEGSNALEIEKAFVIGRERARRVSGALEGLGLMDRIARLPVAHRQKIFAQLSTVDLARLAYHWASWARPKQRPPVDQIFRIIMWLAGRGFGKTKCAAERVRERIYRGARAIAIMGPTFTEIERYQLGCEGADSGLLNVFHPKHKPVYVGPPKSIVRFHTGAVGYVVSGETPEFRGANLDTVWASEIAKWRFLTTLWTNMELATRARAVLPLEIIVDTTPLPLQFLKELIGDEECMTIIGATSENPHTDARWRARMEKKLGGTRLGAQELEAEVLSDNPDALFVSSILEATRVERGFEPDEMKSCVPVDPAIATELGNDDTGMGLMGIDDHDHLYVFEDFSKKAKPEEWGGAVIDRYVGARADAVVCERNRGGDLVESNIRACAERHKFKDGTTGGSVFAKSIVIVNVHATKGKAIRAEPVSSLHKNGYLHMVGRHPALENEITNWNPAITRTSPNRLDMMVWGAFYLARLEDFEERTDFKKTSHGLGMAVEHLTKRHESTTGMEARTMGAPVAQQSPVLAALSGFRRGRGSVL